MNPFSTYGRELAAPYRGTSATCRLYIHLRLVTCPFDRIADFLPRPGSMLDLGCGSGIWCHLAAREGFRVVGADPDRSKLSWFRQSASNAPEIEIQEADAALALRTSSSFDVISLLDVLYLLHEHAQECILSELREHLRPGGRVIVKTMHERAGIKAFLLRAQETAAVNILRYTHGHGIHIMGSARIAEILARSGLHVHIHRIDESYPHPHAVVVADVPN